MKKIFFSAALMGLALAACTNNDEIFVEEEKGIETISAEIIQPAGVSSRIIIGDQLADGTYPVKWRADNPNSKPDEADVIAVYDSKGNIATFKYVEEQDGTAGVFIKKAGSTIYDVKGAFGAPSTVSLPSNKVTINEDGVLGFPYMNTMMYHRGSENAPMFGQMGEDGILKFQVLTGLLRINIPNFKTDFLANSKKGRMGMKISACDPQGNPKKIASTTAEININDNPMTVKLTGADKDFIAIMMEAGIFDGMEDSPAVYCPLLPGEYGKISIEIHDSNAYGDLISNIVTITPKEGSTLTIDRKLYSITPTFTYVAPEK